MHLDYFLLVFFSAVGVYQIVSIPAKLEGLWFYGQPKIQVAFGILTIVGAFAWFFTDQERNVQHTVEGTQQLGLFLAAILAAFFATAIVASVLEARVGTEEYDPVPGKQYELGFETLKTRTLLGGILRSLRKKESITDDAPSV